MFKIGIVGGTGYTGVELLRLLAVRNDISISVLTSRTEENKKISSVYPWLSFLGNKLFQYPKVDNLYQCDVVFFATPSGVAMEMAEPLVEEGVKIIDLSADFRFKNIELWSSTYKSEHCCPRLAKEAVYGLPEYFRNEIKGARIVANPGCYPTATLLALFPLLNEGLISKDTVILDAKSGISGAGRVAREDLLFSENAENFRAYGADFHRHGPEILSQIKQFSNELKNIVFVPHLLPLIRGIEVTAYLNLNKRLSSDELRILYKKKYVADSMVIIEESGIHPQTRWVRGSNICRIGIFTQNNNETIIISSVIDNLVKGAAGQAVQNLNVMLGLDDNYGLQTIGFVP